MKGLSFLCQDRLSAHVFQCSRYLPGSLTKEPHLTPHGLVGHVITGRWRRFNTCLLLASNGARAHNQQDRPDEKGQSQETGGADEQRARAHWMEKTTQLTSSRIETGLRNGSWRFRNYHIKSNKIPNVKYSLYWFLHVCKRNQVFTIILLLNVSICIHMYIFLKFVKTGKQVL